MAVETRADVLISVVVPQRHLLTCLHSDYLIGAAFNVTEHETNMEGQTKDASSTAPKLLSPAQKQLLKRQQELEHWKRHSKQLRSRNLITGLTIGAFVLGLFSYTILSVRQERIMDEIDDEAKVFIVKGPRTGANS